MSVLEALLLGLVQGLTEFLPVSSSGHLTIAKEFFGIDSSSLAFEVAVHAATVLSTIVVFRKEIWSLLCGLFKFKFNAETKYICMILISLIPVFVVGMFFKDKVEAIFGSGLLVVGIALIVTSLLLSISELLSPKGEKSEKGIGVKSAIVMGLAQAVAVIPGLSRSGSTISAGLLCGVKKSEVAKFSFLMVLIPILGEAFLELVGGELTAASSGIEPVALIVGFISAFASGLFACKVMIELVKRTRLRYFAYYCVVVGLFCVIWELFL